MNTIHTRKPDYNFKEMTDEQVVVIAQEEQKSLQSIILLINIKTLFVQRRSSYFLVGADQ